MENEYSVKRLNAKQHIVNIDASHNSHYGQIKPNSIWLRLWLWHITPTIVYDLYGGMRLKRFTPKTGRWNLNIVKKKRTKRKREEQKKFEMNQSATKKK